MAGEQALQKLYETKESLNSAGKWGIWDLIGGGFLADWMKHSRIESASVQLEEAKSKLLVFQRELQDVDVPLDIRVDIGSFLSFADFFLDGIIADYMVQSRIADAREQVEDAIERVEQILRELDHCLEF